jgi:hypothetical protein
MHVSTRNGSSDLSTVAGIVSKPDFLQGSGSCAHLHVSLAPPAALAHHVAHLVGGLAWRQVVQQVRPLVAVHLQLHAQSIILRDSVLKQGEDGTGLQVTSAVSAGQDTRMSVF